MKVGRCVLEYAEQLALQKVPELDSAIMYVLDVRSELIAYYERRGYTKTGHVEHIHMKQMLEFLLCLYN